MKTLVSKQTRRTEHTLSSTSRANAINGSLIELENEVLVHIMILVVGIKDDARVVGVDLGDIVPEGFERGYIGDDVIVIATEVVRVEDGPSTVVGDVVDSFGQVLQVTLVEC